jgi:nucleoside-diphosphate-sugar epimerase
MKILVTGGTGFIGSNIIPSLLSKGHEVYNLERYVTGRHTGTKICPTYFSDLRDGFSVRKIMRDLNPEAVIHLASISAVSYSYEHPQEVMESNLIGTINLAEACLKDTHNFKQFLFAGTSEEYGNNGFEVQTEENPLKPASPYAVSKVACERYLGYMKEAYDFPITILRPFNTFGRKNDSHFLIERTITQMLTTNVVNLIDPSPIRDWMYVDDHVNAYQTCLGNERAIGETFNFSTGKGYSVKDTVEKISELTKFKGKINWGTSPKRPTESRFIIGSYEKANKILKWSPKYSLGEGLQETINYWKKKLQSA